MPRDECSDLGVRLMGNELFIGIVSALFFGGFGIAFGGYSLEANHHLAAVLSYVFGGGCVTAAIVLATLRLAQPRRFVEAENPRGLFNYHDPPTHGPPPSEREEIKAPVQQQITNDLDKLLWPMMAYQPPSERIFVDKTPQELTKIFKTYIDAQAEKLIQPYMGKWLRIAGPVQNASQISGKFWQVFLHLESDSMFGIQIVLYFANTWTEHLSLISRGTNINVIGRISKISSGELDLQACELIQ